MVDKTKSTIYRITYDVAQSLRNLRSLEIQLSKIERLKDKLKDIVIPVSTSSSTQRRAADDLALAERTAKKREVIERRATAARIAAEKDVEKAIKATERAIAKRDKAAAKAAKQAEVSARKIAKEEEKATKAAIRAREQFKKTFLSIGKNSGRLRMVAQNAAATALSLISLHRVLQKTGEAKDRYMRFDELTTATLNITNAGESAFEYGSKGAERYRDAVREAADEVKTTAGEMADSAHFWAKAGQKNADTIAELSKVGTLFARANRDAANNVLSQARSNDILSDALTLFRKDTSSTEKATASATKLADQMTAAANAANMSVEQLFEFAKKAAPLAVTGEISEQEVMAISGSLASAGLKAEEPGRLVRRILTQFAREDVQKRLRGAGVELQDKDGAIRGFSDIFGDLQGVLSQQNPLERLGFLKKIVGQNAISVAAALSGLNDEGETGKATSIKAILEDIEEGTGIVQRNQDQYLKTTAGRAQALTAQWSNAFDGMLEKSGLIQKILGGLEDMSPDEVFEWFEKTAVPAMESLGDTVQNTIIPGLQMAGENLAEWFNPALTLASDLIGSTSSGAEGLSDTITTLVKLWVKWRIAAMAIKGLRMVDWLANFTRQAKSAALATKGVTTATTTMAATTKSSVASSKTAVATLPGAFTAAGIGITAAIAAWGLYDMLVGPIRDAERRIADFKIKHGEGFQFLKPGEEKFSTLQGRIRDLETEYDGMYKSADSRAMQSAGFRDILEGKKGEIGRLRDILNEQIRGEYGAGQFSKIAGYAGGQGSEAQPWEHGGSGRTVDIGRAAADFWSARHAGDEELVTKTREAYEVALDEKIRILQGERASFEQKREETLQEFAEATTDQRDELQKHLESNQDRLGEIVDEIGEYTQKLDGVATSMAESSEKDRLANVAEKAAEKRKELRRRSFQGGRSKRATNPFVTPLSTGLNKDGDRIVRLAMKRGNHADYLNQAQSVREIVGRQIAAKHSNIISVHFGDQSISVIAKTDADPHDIANAIGDGINRINDTRREDIQHFLVNKAPPEI